MKFITVGVEISCVLRFTLAANYGAHTLQFGDGGLILCLSRIRKFVTYPRRTHREQTEKAITEATLILWITRLSRPILNYARTWHDHDNDLDHGHDYQLALIAH